MAKDDISHLKVLKNWHLDFSLFEKISCPIPWDLADAADADHSRWPKQPKQIHINKSPYFAIMSLLSFAKVAIK